MAANCRPLFSIIITEAKCQKFVRYLKYAGHLLGFVMFWLERFCSFCWEEGADEKEWNNRRDHREQTVQQIKLNPVAM